MKCNLLTIVVFTAKQFSEARFKSVRIATPGCDGKPKGAAVPVV